MNINEFCNTKDNAQNLIRITFPFIHYMYALSLFVKYRDFEIK